MRRLLLLFVVLFPIQSNFGRLEIVVRDANTREAVPGVPMTLTASTGNEVRNPTSTVLTDPRGLVAFPSLPPGAYFMKVDGEGFTAVSFNEYVLIEAGSQKRVEISLNQVATVSGRVLDPMGLPLKDSTLYLLQTNYVGGRQALRTLGRRESTGADGTFRFVDIPFGDYYIRVDNSNALDSVGASDFPRYVYYPAATETSGATRLSVRTRELAVGDVRIPDTRVYKISGTVVNPLGPPSASFFLAPSNITLALDPALLLARFTQSADRSELTFEIDGIVPGPYVLYHISRSASPTSRSESLTRLLVNVEDRDIAALRVVAKPNALLQGRVVFASPSTATFENVRVGVVSHELLPFELGRRLGQAVESTGKFTLSELVDGARYGISVIGLPQDAYVRDVRMANVSILNEGSFIAGSSNDALEIEVASPGGTLRGTVRDAANQPVSKAVVVVVPDWTRRGNSLFYRRTPTDVDGGFTIRGIAPGDYQLYAFAVAPPGGAEEDPNFMAPYTGRGITLRATAGGTAEGNLRIFQ